MGFFELYEQVKGNITYWARNIMVNTNHGIDVDDAFQELLISMFNEWSSKEKVTKYYIQKRLYYENIRILRNYYLSNEAKLNPIYIETLRKRNEDSDDFDYDVGANDEIEKLLDKLETETVFNELMYKLENDGSQSKKVLGLLMTGMSLRDIAVELNMKKSNVFKIKEQRIKKTLESIVNKL